jgi:hypothetical protein
VELGGFVVLSHEFSLGGTWVAPALFGIGNANTHRIHQAMIAVGFSSFL